MNKRGPMIDRFVVSIVNERTKGHFNIDIKCPDEESWPFLIESCELLERWLQSQKASLDNG